MKISKMYPATPNQGHENRSTELRKRYGSVFEKRIGPQTWLILLKGHRHGRCPRLDDVEPLPQSDPPTVTNVIAKPNWVSSVWCLVFGVSCLG